MRNGMSYSEAGMLGAEAARKTNKNKSIKRKENYLSNPKKCKHCSIELSYKKRHNKYCSRSCAATVNNTGVRRHGKKQNDKCIHCGEKFIVKNYKGKKYCSNKCMKDFLLNKRVESGLASARSYKNYLIRENGNKCSSCGNEKWMGKPIPIELDHIDGNYKNNKLKNLRLLCPNCHAQTPTYKGKNIGNGRFYRRQRYKEGKSY